MLVDTFWDESAENFWRFHDMHGMHGRGAMASMVWPFHVFAADDSRVESWFEQTLDNRVAQQDFITFENSSNWTPDMMMKVACYLQHYHVTGRQASLDNARILLDGMTEHRTLAGFIPERYFGHGVLGSGKPLLSSL